MSDTDEKTKVELSIFREFAIRSCLSIDKNSIQKRPSPEPDILCEIPGKGLVAFELKEICDEAIARVVSELRKGTQDDPVYLRAGRSLDAFLRRTRGKRYTTTYPMELLFYTDGRYIAAPDTLIPRIQFFFCNNRQPFQGVWFMGGIGETCERVVCL